MAVPEMMFHKMKQKVKKARRRKNWKILRQKLHLVKDLEKEVVPPPGLARKVWIE